MIDVKQAVKKAADYLKELYAERTLTNLDVEEVEKSDDERFWLVTLGYTDDALNRSAALSVLGAGGVYRKYKVCKIDATSGECVSMKMREPSLR
jgi:hypothetical protein